MIGKTVYVTTQATATQPDASGWWRAAMCRLVTWDDGTACVAEESGRILFVPTTNVFGSAETAAEDARRRNEARRPSQRVAQPVPAETARFIGNVGRQRRRAQ